MINRRSSRIQASPTGSHRVFPWTGASALRQRPSHRSPYHQCYDSSHICFGGIHCWMASNLPRPAGQLSRTPSHSRPICSYMCENASLKVISIHWNIKEGFEFCRIKSQMIWTQRCLRRLLDLVLPSAHAVFQPAPRDESAEVPDKRTSGISIQRQDIEHPEP
jgi:hypothetical protein